MPREEGITPRAGPDREFLGELSETRIQTRRAVRARGDIVYGTDVETSRMRATDGDPELLTESHSGAVQAECGCLIEGNLKPRFHRDGTMVCQGHYYFCGICNEELLPLELVVVEKRVYCRLCGEKAVDEILHAEASNPGFIDAVVVAHLSVLKKQLRKGRWKRALNRFLGRGDTRGVQ